MVVTRATRNRFVGVEPARGFESHRLRQNRQPPRLSVLFLRWVRTREGFAVKETVWHTVFRQKSLSGSESRTVCKARPQQTANPTVSAKNR